MYNASLEYRDKIQELDRVFKLEIRIEHSTGTLVLEDKDIAQGSLQYQSASQVGDEFTVGGVFANNISFKIVNKDKYDTIKFDGAKVYPKVFLLLEEAIDAHFMQPSQPTKALDFEDRWEAIPLGVFNIDIADRLRSTIDIKAIDNMIFLDKPYSLSKLSYPATLNQIYTNICNVADVSASSVGLVNGGFVVQNRPDGELTLRNVLSFVAELTGSFATFNKLGGLELRWYKESGITLTPDHRSELKMADETIQITGVAIESEEKDVDGNLIVNLMGTDEYAIDLTGNPLVGTNYSGFQAILDRVGATIFNPYTANFHGNPALEVGDIVTHVDIDGVSHKTIVTNLDYKYRGTSKIEAKAKSNIVRGYKSTDNRIASIISKIEKDVGDQLTDLEQAIVNATNLINDSLGGYVVKEKDQLLIMNNPKKELATQVWRWNLGGLGYSSNGMSGPFETAMTMDGSINAKFITTGGLSASMVQTGTLQSEDGGTVLNLDTGTFNFRNIFSLNNNGATINIGNPSSGNYLKLAPSNPLEVYRNSYKMVEIWTEASIGGYLLLNNTNGTETLRLQTSGTGNDAVIMCNNLRFGGTTVPTGYRSVSFGEDVDCMKDFRVFGTKNAIVETENYGNRLLYCEESDRIYFNTKGIESTVNNKYIIRLDDVFIETIEPNSINPYIINLTPYANARVWIKDVFDKYIIVESDVDCKFAYNIQCTRKGYSDTYLEEVNIREKKMEGRNVI